ncbi:hypothetical protein ATE35_06840 [Streptococcus oralis subsp. tigurinus]|uniref:Uncharacterized protein n=1 Tax=Streptococcus oralis subsp. tigurinus TaxID=1077464 RepID=A0A1X0WT72_STROR|nr:hypothetical protein ATE35_06840 [Streptococcus oralis subsp. tigurinus]
MCRTIFDGLQNIAALSDFSLQFNWIIAKSNDSIIVVIKEFRIGLAKPAGDAPFRYKCEFHIYIVIRKFKKYKE